MSNEQERGVRVTIRLTPQQLEWLKELARRKDRPWRERLEEIAQYATLHEVEAWAYAEGLTV